VGEFTPEPQLPGCARLAPRLSARRAAKTHAAARSMIGNLLRVAPALAMAGCTSLGLARPSLQLKPISIETVRYYPYLVKGYQDSFPHRSVLVLAPVDAHGLGNPKIAPLDGRPEIGVTNNRSEVVLQRLYSAPLAPIVQKAIAHSADEAGLLATVASGAKYDPRRRGVDYVLASTITQCWVKKHLAANGDSGPAWRTVAKFALEVTLYKPPFKVAFWKGESSVEYEDPAWDSYALGPGDEISIYEHPGEDLSVAMSRAVAGIFQRQDLHMLVLEDRIGSP
jgi:hypothetical protein